MITYQKILQTIAMRNGTTPEAVEAEMKKGLRTAFQNGDAEAKQLQRAIVGSDDCPTPEEFIFQAARFLQGHKNE